MTKQTWQKEGKYPCELCGKGFAQTYNGVKAGKYIASACWNCLYK